jgi:hypothetical protein
MLESFTLFLYTWRFLEYLEKEEERIYLKRFFKTIAILTIIILPLGSYSVFTAYVIE